MSEGRLHLGEEVDEAGARTGTRVEIDPAHLTTHGVILGMTGSGKTGLGVVLLEEALLRGIPALILDPKGDMGNLLLNFPALRGEDFRPWIDEAEAARAGTSADDYAASIARRWQKGLSDWDLSSDAMRRLGTSAGFTIFTPGSDAGVPIDVVGSLAAPDAALTGEARSDRIEGFVSGLLALVGRTADPLSSADHILLSNLVARAWDAGQDLDLATLIAQVANPPIRRLGVFELDTFMPPKDRMALAVQLNALLASPSFGAWLRGVPLDMKRLLWTDSGRPRAAIVYLAHLSDAERQFIVTLILSQLVGWMRTQPGTSELRALVYMDEVAGFAPPTAQPPSKKPMLTILRQARAHGLGMVLSTQNPVDLDYKALSNAGTWLIGRLQTERDKARVLDGMRSAAGDVDIASLDRVIGGLGQRQFLLHTARGGAPRRCTTRWAMSYLRGPLTRVEIAQLTGDRGDPASTAPPPVLGSLGPSEITVAPNVAAGVRVRYMDPGAPWVDDVGAHPGSRTLRAAVAARVHLRFDDATAGFDHRETFECIYFPLTDPPRHEDVHVVDYDERDLRTEPPPRAAYSLPDAPIDRPAYFRDLEKQLREHLRRSRTAEVLVNRELKAYSRPGESREEFSERCAEMAATRADADAAKLREKYAAQLQRIEQQQRTAEHRVRELSADARQRVQQEVLAGAGQLLSVFLGGRARASTLSGAASRRGVTRRTQERLETAKSRADDLDTRVRQLEDDLADELARIQEKWEGVAGNVESRAIPLGASDITVEEVVLLWIPVEP